MNDRRKVLILSISILVAASALVFCLKKFVFKPKEVVKARVAIVIDDWGYNLDSLDLLKGIHVPLTISILPNLKYSSLIAQQACALKQQVILHLPLEPVSRDKEYVGLEKNTITTNMSKEEIVQILAQALNSVPYASGVSNHMGSKATQNKEVMSVIFNQLKKKKLFFLDNLVTSKSIGKELAEQIKIKIVFRDFFLDNESSRGYVKKQFAQLCTFALQTGKAVGIAHAKPLTLKVLQEEIPLMRAKGIKFIFVSDLVK